MILPAKKIQNGPRPFQKGCETVFSFISILAGRSEMRTFYLELLKNFKFEVGHKNVSIYFSLDTWRWAHLVKKILNYRERSINIFSNVSRFMYLIFWVSCLIGKPQRNIFPVVVWANSLDKSIMAGLVAESPPVDCGRSSWWNMLMIWPLWWH